MKIVPKLTLALMVGTCGVLAIDGYLRVRREVAVFEADRLRDHDRIGRSLAASMAAVWKSGGGAAAVQSLEAVNDHFTRIHVRWVGAGNGDAALIDSAAPAARAVTRVVSNVTGPRTWYTYVPLDVDGARRGVIELSEAATAETRFSRNTFADTIASVLVLALLSAGAAFVMGQWFVGRPVRALAEKARRIGRGDFAGPIVLKQRDELAELASEMNSMCERLASTLDQLRHADRLATVGKLASGVAHELGTPLTVVSARAGMIVSGETSDGQTRECGRAILDAARRMTKIIRQLLQFARRTGVRKESRDLHELTKEMLVLLEPLAEKHAARIELAPTDEDTTAAVDAGPFQQVVTNLVMNAIQAMPRGGTIRLSLCTARLRPPPDVGGTEGEYLCLRVADDGEGIAPEHLHHVFEPFFTTKDVGEGTGLGLPVSYGIMRDHGGWIAAESRMREGATFTVFVPRSQA